MDSAVEIAMLKCQIYMMQDTNTQLNALVLALQHQLIHKDEVIAELQSYIGSGRHVVIYE